ncbi:MAG: hypothetical protein CVV27_13480 [Candidatus Melainabacteria bacterium HGW-Melainabacteria-1]|nr:MAG: hypothetical protein CVV27_13480 [Candidatus Melainabacteria bacterium HGW-Melainabacteria-1]
MSTAAALATHFLCQPIRPAWSRTAFLAPQSLLRPSMGAGSHGQLSQAERQSGPLSDSLAFLWKLYEKSHQPSRRALIIQQIGRTPGSFDLLERLGALPLSEDEMLALIESLARHPDPRQLPLLQALYRRCWSQPRFQQEILLAAGRTRSEAGLRFLQEIYASAWHRPEYRQTVIRALGFQASAEAVAMLVRLSAQSETDLHLQRSIIKALGYSSCAASARVLEQMLTRYPQPEMRALTWRALAATGSDTAVEVLRRSLSQTKSPKDRQALNAALKKAYRD